MCLGPGTEIQGTGSVQSGSLFCRKIGLPICWDFFADLGGGGCKYSLHPPPPSWRPNSADLADLFCRFVGFLDFLDSFCRLPNSWNTYHRSPFKGLGSPFKGPGSSFKGSGSPFEGLGSPFEALGSPFKGLGSPFKGLGSPFKGSGSLFKGLGSAF